MGRRDTWFPFYLQMGMRERRLQHPDMVRQLNAVSNFRGSGKISVDFEYADAGRWAINKANLRQRADEFKPR